MLMRKKIQMKPVLVVFICIVAAVSVYSILLKPSIGYYYCEYGLCNSLETDRAIAQSHITRSIQFREFGGSGLVENNFSVLSNGHEFSYYFDTSSEDIRGFDAVVSVMSGMVESSIFTEILREDFCGRSTMSYCLNNLDCVRGGCSGSICQAKTDEQVLTTCEYRDCYDAASYGLSCSCVDSKCQWA